VIRCLLAVALFALAARPASARTPEEVQALMARAVDYIRDFGFQKGLDEFNRPDGPFVDGELYIFCNNAAGLQLANGGNPKMVGKNMSGLRDAEGRATNSDMFRLAQTQGQGWYEYIWPNAAKRKLQRKVAYVVRIDDQTFCASGYYKPDQP
jgi:hypothetical protein